MTNVYVDGCFDLFHYGHILFLKKSKGIAEEYNSKLIVGILNDETIESYKRVPILKMKERAPMLEACIYVDKLVLDAPLILTKDYLKKYDIGTICIPSNRLPEEIEEWYKDIGDIRLVKIKYTEEISTTDIIKNIKSL